VQCRVSLGHNSNAHVEYIEKELAKIYNLALPMWSVSTELLMKRLRINKVTTHGIDAGKTEIKEEL